MQTAATLIDSLNKAAIAQMEADRRTMVVINPADPAEVIKQDSNVFSIYLSGSPAQVKAKVAAFRAGQADLVGFRSQYSTAPLVINSRACHTSIAHIL
jgi:hypothetical protein